MEKKDGFKMTYSAGRQEEIQAIREKYVPKEEDKMTRLRTLDAGAEKKASMAAIIVGVIGTLIFGVGMSLAMSEFGSSLGAAALPMGIVCGVIGLCVLGIAYPLYNRTLEKERKKIAPEILRLTDELMK